MKKRFRHVLVISAFVVGGMVATQGAALADPGVGPNGEFLCPAVGDGVANADTHNGENGVSVIGPIASGHYSFKPGNNQAGVNANGMAINPNGPGDSAGPGGGNSDWSPIWPEGGNG